MIIRLPQCSLQISSDVAFIAENATLIGDLILAADVSVWFQAVIRADNAPISIGKGTNIQDGCICHTDPGVPITIGQYVTVGHRAVLHGCSIGDFTLIGINAVVLNHAKIGKNCLIGANTLVTEGMEIPDNSLVIGSPGKVVRTLSTNEITRLTSGATEYIKEAKIYKCLPTSSERHTD